MSTQLTKINQSIQSGISNKDFLSMMSGTELRGSSRPRPKSVRLNGQTGVYETREWSETEKKMTNTPYGNPWGGVILLVKWFAKWKFGSTQEGQAIRTREFATFNDPIELLEIDYKKGEDATKVLGNYADYREFKAEHLAKDKLTGKETAPFDLWASVYAWNHMTDEVVNFRMKGLSRSNLWDYLGDYKKQLDGVEALAGIVTKFDQESKSMPGDASKEFYTATMKVLRFCTEVEMEKVKEATMQLVSWMRSFDVEDEEHVVKITTVPEDEINVDSLPF